MLGVAKKYVGRPCPKGHDGLRYVSNKGCVECLRHNLPRDAIMRAKPLNREKAAARQRSRAARTRSFVRSEREKPCTDCGESFPWYVTEFDHLVGGASETVARLTAIGTMSRVVAEIAKCDLVCANCHKVRTHRRALLEGQRHG